MIVILGIRLEWNGLTLVYTADSQPSTFEAEQGTGADVFIHEIFPSAEEFAHYNHMPIEAAYGVMEEHTTPAELGRVYTIAKPRLGVGMHFTLETTSSTRSSSAGERRTMAPCC